MLKKLQEKTNIFIAKSPRKAVLVGIMLFNVIFIMIAAGIIAILSQHLSGLKACGFWESVYYTITMILDAGCIDNVITDVGQAGAFAAIVCIIVIVLGMIFFTGAVIGYVTNVISDFIDSKNNGKNKLHLSDHIVIVNWNARGQEIMNEFLYANKRITIIVFVSENRDEIAEEIQNRLNTTLIKEAQPVNEASTKMPFFEKRKFYRKNLLKNKLTYIVREGDVAAATDLDDICISKAKTVIILDNKSAHHQEIGNTQTIKTLIQVSEVSKGNFNQTILVEVDDAWTENLVNRIIDFKNGEGQERVIPVTYNRLLGQTNAHIAMTPEINGVYDLLSSNKGAHILSQNVSTAYSEKNEDAYIENLLIHNRCSIPLTIIKTSKGNQAFFLTDTLSDMADSHERNTVKTWAKLKETPEFRKRNIIILGHNSNMISLMEGFKSIRENWQLTNGREIFHLIMVDDETTLKKYQYYSDYPNVTTFAANINNDQNIYEQISGIIGKNNAEETTILILSDDEVGSEDMDANVLTYLIYIQGQIRQREKDDSDFTRAQLNIIVEILNPKNEEIVKNYGADHVVISHRYASRMISHISLGETTNEFFAKILSYDLTTGKKIFVIPADDFFEVIPGKCTAGELIRMVFAGGEKKHKSMVLGYVRNHKEYVFFSGDQNKIDVKLRPEDKLILFSNVIS